MKTVALFDIDSKIPNLALMKISSFYKEQGWKVIFSKNVEHLKADLYFASTVFSTNNTINKVAGLKAIYGNDIEIGGSGIDLTKRLPNHIEECFPDYSLYNHTQYALGFLTRGCSKKCPFCVVPVKEGKLKSELTSFSGFVPPGWKNIMLLDDNLLEYAGAPRLLEEMSSRDYKVNFSQTLDISRMDESLYRTLLKVDSQNARFTRRQFYFSMNYPAAIKQFQERKSMLKGFGKDSVSVVSLYGYDTSLSQDYSRWMTLRRLQLIPFFQQYWPIKDVPANIPKPFFDMELDEVIRLTFRGNGHNWEKYLRWLSRLYFQTFGRYYKPLIETIYRYNNKKRIHYYLNRPETLTSELYYSYH